MTKYEFQGTLYRTESEMLLALASMYLSAGGLHTEETQRELLDEVDDAALADDCIKGWCLDRPEEDGPSWLEARDLDRSDIEAAFYDVRARF